MRTRLLVLLLLAGLPATAPAQTLNGRFLDQAIDSVAAAHLAEGQVAGLTVAVARGDDLLHHESYGKADLELDVQMPLDAVYQVGSITKQFTAVLVLQLVEEGVLDLDADFTTYLPEFDAGDRIVPLRRLLDHTSGIKGYTEMPIFGSLAVQPLPRDSLVTLVERAEWDFDPGTALIYNNSGYFLAGLVLEAVTETPYEELLQERIFEPLGMERSHYCSNSRVVPDRAHGYDAPPGGLQRTRYLDHRWPYAAGSVCSTARDLIRWNQALHGGEVLSPTMYDLLVTPEPLLDGSPVRYAKGLTHARDDHGEVIEHGGGINGFLSAARHYPEEGLTVVVLQNTTGPQGPEAVSQGIVDLLLPSSTPEVTPFPGDLDPLAGTYRGPGRGRPVEATVTLVGGRLQVVIGGQSPQAMMHLGDGVFASPEAPYGARAWFVDEDGRVIGAGGTGTPASLRLDQGGAHLVLGRR